VPWLTVERLGAICDGVIAIIITLLVLEIKVPEGHDFSAGGVVSFMHKASRDIMVYLLNFALIGMFWLQHHVIFHYVHRTNRVFIFLNGLFLFLLSLSPFSTSLVGTYRGVKPAEFVFGVNFLLSGLTLLVIWRYLAKNETLQRKPIPMRVVRSMSRRIMIAPIVILVGMFVSLINFHVAALIYFTAPAYYLKHWLVDTSWQDE
jgi:uncharacterized membrane protein